MIVGGFGSVVFLQQFNHFVRFQYYWLNSGEDPRNQVAAFFVTAPPSRLLTLSLKGMQSFWVGAYVSVLCLIPL